jgi:hypothetical protein
MKIRVFQSVRCQVSPPGPILVVLLAVSAGNLIEVVPEATAPEEPVGEDSDVVLI